MPLLLLLDNTLISGRGTCMQVNQLARALHEANERWEEDQESLEKMRDAAALELQQLAAASSRIRWVQKQPAMAWML